MGLSVKDFLCACRCDAMLNTSGIYTKTFPDYVGVASGVRVRTITVLFDGRYAHAFPGVP